MGDHKIIDVFSAIESGVELPDDLVEANLTALSMAVASNGGKFSWPGCTARESIIAIAKSAYDRLQEVAGDPSLDEPQGDDRINWHLVYDLASDKKAYFRRPVEHRRIGQFFMLSGACMWSFTAVKELEKIDRGEGSLDKAFYCAMQAAACYSDTKDGMTTALQQSSAKAARRKGGAAGGMPEDERQLIVDTLNRHRPRSSSETDARKRTLAELVYCITGIETPPRLR